MPNISGSGLAIPPTSTPLAVGGIVNAESSLSRQAVAPTEDDVFGLHTS